MPDALQASASAMPTSHDRSFVSYLLGSDPKFERALPDTLVQEGGYSNDAHDPGGMTMQGIIQKEYDAKRRQWGLPTRWVKQISPNEMRTIYFTDYWMPYCPELPAGLDLEMFDQNVNEGPHRSIVLLQRALAVNADGVFGDQTRAAIKTYVDAGTVVQLIDRYMIQREKFYRGLPTFKFFGKDWIRRSEVIDKQARALALA
jgi:lysozyme family protein